MRDIRICRFIVIGAIFIFVAGLAGPVAPILAAVAQRIPPSVEAGIAEHIYKYLPSRSKIRNPNQDIAFADLDGDAEREVIVFFSVGDTPNDHSASILVLRRSGSDYVRLWGKTYEDSWGFASPTGVNDLNRSGRPQIVAYRTIGASCPGVLEIYEYRDGAIRSITGEWADNGQCQSVEIKDLNGDGKSEIIATVQKYGANPDIYAWDGRRYVRSNNQFPEFYAADLQRLLQNVRSPQRLPASARVMWCRQAVEIYLLQQRYSDAITLCREVLQMIDNPRLTKPEVSTGTKSSEQQSQNEAAFASERLRGRVAVYQLLGDSFKALGDQQQAQDQYKKAQDLQSQPRK